MDTNFIKLQGARINLNADSDILGGGGGGALK